MVSQLKTINVRFQDEVYEIISQLALKKGISRGAVIRALIDNKIRYADTAKYDQKELVELNRLLSIFVNHIVQIERQIVGLGNNVNQIAKKVNSGNRNQEDIETLKQVSLSITQFKSEIVELNKHMSFLRGDRYGVN